MDSCVIVESRNEVTVSSKPIHCDAIGAARIIIQSAHIHRELRRLHRCPNPFVRINASGQVGCTRWQKKTFSPNWLSQSHFFLVYSSKDLLELDVLDHCSLWKPASIGSAVLPLESVIDANHLPGIQVVLTRGDDTTRPKGTLLFDVFYYPIVQPIMDVHDNSPLIVCITLHGAKNLHCNSTLSKNTKLVAMVSLGWDKSPIYTISMKSENEPILGSPFEFLCFEGRATLIVVKLTEKGPTSRPVGYISITLNDLLDAEKEGDGWWPLAGCQGGQLKMTALCKSIGVDKFAF